MAHFADIRAASAPNGGLDLSDYHALEHSFVRCTDPVKHARLWWSYFGRERAEYLILGWVSQHFFCRFGRHTWLAAWDLDDRASGQLCNWCDAWR